MAKRALALMILATVLAAPAPARELAANGSFEQGEKAPAGWVGSDGARWADGGKSGKCAVLGPAPRPEAWVTWRQEIRGFRPGTLYLFSAWVRADQPCTAQVLIDGVKPHASGSDYFYMQVGTEWRLWVKEAVGDPGSSPTVQLTLLNEGGKDTFYFDDVSLTVRDEVAATPVPVRQVPDAAEGREPGDLVTNGHFELGQGEGPLGWFHGDPGLMPRTAAGKYFHDPAKETGACTWEKTGYSGRSLSVAAPKGDGWGGWCSQLHGIKPNTKYTVEFWYRMSRKGALRVFLFGRELVQQEMPGLNPRHWWRCSATVDSGAASGECNVGFVAEAIATAETRAWIDNVELFEGVSPIGTNVARLIHYYYDFTWVSPDAVSPVPFAFEWCFGEEKWPEEIAYVVELPREVELKGHYIGRLRHTTPWRTLWTGFDETAAAEKQDAEIGGLPYVRYTFRQKQDRSGDPKSFGRDGYLPVGIRNNWHTYTGTQALMLYVLGKKAEGDLPPAYYHATWRGGQQNKQTLALRPTRIPPVPPLKKMALIAGAAWHAPEQNPQFLRDYARMGFNGLHYLSARDPANLKKTIAEARQQGFRTIAAWTNMPAYESSDPDAKGMGLDFARKGEDHCLEYRGKDWARLLGAMKARMNDGYNTFLFDDASPSTCHCAACKRLFREFLQNFPGLDYVSPGDFLAPDWAGSALYRQAWADFPLWHYGRTAQALKDELERHAQAKGLEPTVYFGISSWLHAQDPLAASSLTAFDFDSHQTYMNWSLETFQASPRRTGDVLRDRQARLGPRALPLVPTISPGLGYMSQLCSLDPHEQMKYQILEMMMAPKARGYTVYAPNDFDLGDMKFAAEANALLARFEDLFADGEVVEGLAARGTDQSTVRAKRLGGRLLVLVSDYSTYDPIETDVSFDLPAVPSLVDAETGEELKPTGQGTYKVTLKQTRLRILHTR